MRVNEIRQSRKAFGLEIVYVETRSEHERLWGSDETRRRTLELVGRVCVIASSRRKNGDATVLRDRIAGSDPADYCSRIHAAIRQYRKSQLGVIAGKVQKPGNLNSTSTEINLRRTKRPTVLNQLRSLQKSLETSSAYKFEKAYFGLSPQAWDYLAIGFKKAGSNGKLRGFTKVDEPPGHLLLRPMLNVDLLALILPHAIEAAPKGGRPFVSERDQAVAKLLEIFIELTRRSHTGAKRGGFNEPKGDGADFVRSLECIFGIDLMPEGSTHAIDRAERMIRKIP